MVEAWYMDESQEDQRAPHRLQPNRAVSLEQLRRLGVAYRRVSGGDGRRCPGERAPGRGWRAPRGAGPRCAAAGRRAGAGDARHGAVPLRREAAAGRAVPGGAPLLLALSTRGPQGCLCRVSEITVSRGIPLHPRCKIES